MDFAATVKVQDRIDKSAHLRLASLVDNMMEGPSFFASPEFTSIVVLILTGLAFRKRKWRALIIPAAFVLIVLIELYGKSIIHHPSPPFSMIKHTTSVFPANYINEQFSYPSGHAARAIFVALTAWMIFRKRLWLGVGLGAYVLLVALSRIYLGHHWLSDVIGGSLLGSGLGLLTMAFVSPIIDKQ
jgi:membrane-associated phospholipid phosphatase